MSTNLPPYTDLTPNQTRVLIDTTQALETFRATTRTLRRYAGGMTWKTVRGSDYLVKILNRRGSTKSLGPRSEETERIHDEFVKGKTAASQRLEAIESSLKEFAGMSRGVGINRAPTIVTTILRRLDEFGFLEKNLMVIGTNALYAYEAAAAVAFDAGLMGTTDIDLLWDARSSINLAWFDDDVTEAGVLAVLKKADRSFEKIEHMGFRAANSRGFLVDLIKQTPTPPWKKDREAITGADLRPVEIQQVKWLLSSPKFHATLIGQDGMPAPIVAPDPRAFAIYKGWLSQRADRDPRKKRRDLQQALATVQLVRDRFPHLKFDADIHRLFPQETLNQISDLIDIGRRSRV